jgi:nicotinamidase-related amidase
MAASPLDPQRAALLIYDLTQTLVEDGPFLEPWVASSLPALERLVGSCRRASVPVCYAVPAASAAGAEVCHAVAPRDSETVFVHTHSGGFAGTELERWLRGQQRDALLIAGMAVDRGCNTTARQALSRGFRPYVVRGACFTRDITESPVGPVAKSDVERVHLAALHRLGVGIVTVDEVVAALG